MASLDIARVTWASSDSLGMYTDEVFRTCTRKHIFYWLLSYGWWCKAGASRTFTYLGRIYTFIPEIRFLGERWIRGIDAYKNILDSCQVFHVLHSLTVDGRGKYAVHLSLWSFSYTFHFLSIFIKQGFRCGGIFYCILIRVIANFSLSEAYISPQFYVTMYIGIHVYNIFIYFHCKPFLTIQIYI